jgi:hypothetical protein
MGLGAVGWVVALVPEVGLRAMNALFLGNIWSQSTKQWWSPIEQFEKHHWRIVATLALAEPPKMMAARVSAPAESAVLAVQLFERTIIVASCFLKRGGRPQARGRTIGALLPSSTDRVVKEERFSD